ncbi:secondary thiamine-phosphate synthase enzyme YjbQ [uncultured Litoreibacter sp.]|uniref:secondary thiamine-phosphate synthase enzyme YjbQ n=1 Tax=uncultured Litoreibacter sp. TaxID=1392394 RepID=UPI002629BAA7|nr:secondary thiamine-phosphate synthase enzyme YjbQ [uncultured Litoreibacter sp.]
MKQAFFDLTVDVAGKSLHDISKTVQDEVTSRELCSGLLTIWCTHTGASLLVQANADDDVAADIVAFFEELVPKRPGHYRHAPDQDDNAPSHLRALLTQTQISMPVEDGRLALGKVQSLFVFEHREVGRARRLRLHFIGE